MPDTRKGYKVPATVIPGHDSFPVVDSNDVAGNIMFFDSPDKLITIPASKRKLGMFAFISNEGRHYKLINNKAVLDASCWEAYELVSKEYVDNAIAHAAGGGTSTPVDAYTKTESDAKYALKTDIPTVPDISNLETAQHAEDTYAKKTDIPTVPDVSNFVTTSDLHELVGVATSSLTIEDNADTEINMQLELPKDASIIQVNAIAEIEETKEDDTPILATNAFTIASTPITGMTITDYGAKINGCAEPTSENDFVTYGKEGISNE